LPVPRTCNLSAVHPESTLKMGTAFPLAGMDIEAQRGKVAYPGFNCEPLFKTRCARFQSMQYY
jgi:hypothetical protein